MTVASELFPPVETQLAEHVRQVGLEHVSTRWRELVERSKRRELTAPERSEAISSQRVIETLQAMAPVAALQPARAKGMLALGA